MAHTGTERSSLTNIVQLGLETTPGDSVQPTKRLTSIGIEPTVNAEIADFRPAGSKYRSITALGKEWVEASVSGQPTYSELMYPMSSVLSKPTTIGNGTTTPYIHTFVSSSVAADDIATYSVQHGDNTNAGFRESFVNGIFTELSLQFSRNGIDMSGSMIGKDMRSTGNDDALHETWNTSPTLLPLVPLLPTEIDVYLSDTYYDDPDDATKLDRVTGASWSLGSRFNPMWVLDSTLPSFLTHIEAEPSLSAGISVEADDFGMGLFTTMRSGDEKFLKIVARSATDANTSGTIFKQSMMIDMPVRIANTQGFSDEDGLFAIGWDFLGTTTGNGDWAAGPGAGNAVCISLVNKQATL
jgi:hypothetical protein